MKKIGILTYHSVCNFGANLQALSTYSYLKNNGYFPIFVNWMPKDLEHAFENSIPEEQFREHESFRNKHFCMTERCFTDEDVAKVIEDNKIDAIIVGSDAICQHHPLLSRIIFPCSTIINISNITSDRLCPNPFWGSFQKYLSKKIPMAMMSGSSQNSSYKLINKSDRKLIREHLKLFSYVSVRDEWTSNMFRFLSDCKISPFVTPDPVFAFNYNVTSIPSKTDILKKFGINGNYILLSFHNSQTVDYEWLEEFKSLAEEQDFQPIAMAFPNGIKFRHPFKKQINIPLDPLDWYALIKYSNGYVGHNMHPIVVSLHNSVPCFSFDNYGVTRFRFFVNDKSSKIYHIMDKYGCLTNRVSANKLFYKSPSPQYVFSALKKFNIEGCSAISKAIHEEYKIMMFDILNSFENYAK